MSKGLRCPNRSCSHLFLPEALECAQAVTCPRCGLAIQVRSPVVPAEPGPGAEPVAAPLVFDPTAEMSSAGRRRRRSGGWLSFTLGLLLALGAVCGVVWVAGRQIQRAGERELDSPERVHESTRFNYRFALPPEPWKKDDATRVRVKANLMAWQRSDPAGWVALAAKDYGTDPPGETERLEEIVDRLRGHFQDLQYDEPEDAELDGRPARRFVFEGRGAGPGGEDVLLRGECFQVAHQGVVYWLLTWTTADRVEEVGAEWAALRQGFELVNDPDRQEAGPALATYTGTKADYSLQVPPATWRKHEPATDFDGNADLAFHGDPAPVKGTETRSAYNKSVVLLVLVLHPEAGTDPGDAARAHLQKQQHKDYPGTTLEDVTDPEGPPGPKDRVGDVKGQVRAFHVKNTPERQRYVVLATIAQGDRAIVLQFECNRMFAGLWKERIARVLGTFRLTKGD